MLLNAGNDFHAVFIRRAFTWSGERLGLFCSRVSNGSANHAGGHAGPTQGEVVRRRRLFPFVW